MSDEAIWKAVDHYIVESLLPEDPVLEGVLEANKAAGLPAIEVAPLQGKLLHLLARIAGARPGAGDRHARGLLDDLDGAGAARRWTGRRLDQERHAEVRAGSLTARATTGSSRCAVGRALDLLTVARRGAFDLVFIDADKPSNPNYSSGRYGCRGPGRWSWSTT